MCNTTPERNDFFFFKIHVPMVYLGFVCSTEHTHEMKDVSVPLMVGICSVHITEEQKTKENRCLSGSIF